MSSRPLRLGLICTFVASLAGCGFAPAFGTNGSAASLRNAVVVTAPDTVLGYEIRARIDDRFGPVAEPRYQLAITATTQQDAATVNPDGNTTRFQISGAADWVISTDSGQIRAGRAQAFASYGATGSTVATQAAAEDAARRLAVLLADEIVADLILMPVVSP